MASSTAPSPVKAHVVGSGSEFFVPYPDGTDQPVDSNTQYIVNQLALQGVRVIGQEITPDDVTLQTAKIQCALALGASVIVTNAGTGLQRDDTMWGAIARVTGRPLVVDKALRRVVADRQRALGGLDDKAAFNSAVDKQSALPRGAVWLPPPGTAPPFHLLYEGILFMSTPGPKAEARVAMTSLLEQDEVLRFLNASEQPLRLVTARLFGECELGLNKALEDAEAQGLTAGLPDAITRVTHGGAETDVQMQFRPDQAARADSLFSFLRARFLSAMFSSDLTLDQLLAEALAGRSVQIYGSGPAATEAYLRLWSRTSVGARLFESDAESSAFAGQSIGRHGSGRAVTVAENEDRAVKIAESGLSADGPDFAISIVGTSPASACVASAAGERVVLQLTSPMERLSGLPADVLESARDEFCAHELLRMLYVTAQHHPHR